MKHVLACLLLATLTDGAGAFSRSPLPDSAERRELYPAGTRVLVVGYSEYADRSWPALNGRRDAERVQRMFLDRGVPPSAMAAAAWS